MEYRYRISQDDLARIYENAQARMDANPEIAEKHKEAIERCPHFKTEKDALQSAIAMMKERLCDCQIWAKIEKDGDLYHIVDWWIVTNDWKIKQSADYIGMALMYDQTRLLPIIRNNIAIDDIVAYW